MRIYPKQLRPALLSSGMLTVWLLISLASLADARHLSDVERSQSHEIRKPSTGKEALEEFNSLIGGWRGVAQPKRSSSQGAWKEKANWIWDFSQKGRGAIRYEVTDGRLLDVAVLTYDVSRKTYQLAASFTDKAKRKYQGLLQGKKLILESMSDKDGYVYRMTVTRLNEKRTLVLHERRRSRQRFFSRIVEVGYTRQGTRLASSDQAGPKCIVTGGAGTSKVSYKGKTYYVCCSGCRDAFLDDPEEILAEAHVRAGRKRRDDKRD